MHKRNNRTARGFTLPELLVVIAIVAIVSLVVAPWFARIMQRNKLRSAAREVQSTLLATRMTAVRSGVQASVRITPAPSGSPFHKVEMWQDAIPAATPASPAKRLREVRLGTKVRFVTTPPGSDVVFTPDGRRNPPGSAPEVIVLEGMVGSSLLNQITIQTWENGRVAFVTPTQWK